MQHASVRNPKSGREHGSRRDLLLWISSLSELRSWFLQRLRMREKIKPPCCRANFFCTGLAECPVFASPKALHVISGSHRGHRLAELERHADRSFSLFRGCAASLYSRFAVAMSQHRAQVVRKVIRHGTHRRMPPLRPWQVVVQGSALHFSLASCPLWHCGCLCESFVRVSTTFSGAYGGTSKAWCPAVLVGDVRHFSTKLSTEASVGGVAQRIGFLKPR